MIYFTHMLYEKKEDSSLRNEFTRTSGMMFQSNKEPKGLIYETTSCGNVIEIILLKL